MLPDGRKCIDIAARDGRIVAIERNLQAEAGTSSMLRAGWSRRRSSIAIFIWTQRRRWRCPPRSVRRLARGYRAVRRFEAAAHARNGPGSAANLGRPRWAIPAGAACRSAPVDNGVRLSFSKSRHFFLKT